MNKNAFKLAADRSKSDFGVIHGVLHVQYFVNLLIFVGVCKIYRIDHLRWLLGQRKLYCLMRAYIESVTCLQLVRN